MIFTRKDLQEYLKRDNLGFGSQTFYKRMIKRLGGYENYYIYEFFRVLRHYEFYLNLEKRTLLERVFLLYWKYRYNHSRIKSNMFVAPNTFGPGVMIVHPAGSVVNKDIPNNVIVAGVPAKQIGFTLSTN